MATYSISDLAKEFDLTTRAMRFYEDMGLLQPERAGPGGRVTCNAKKVGQLFLVC
jgi:DNA-binding transcriptional MerR regulator